MDSSDTDTGKKSMTASSDEGSGTNSSGAAAAGAAPINGIKAKAGSGIPVGDMARRQSSDLSDMSVSAEGGVDNLTNGKSCNGQPNDNSQPQQPESDSKNDSHPSPLDMIEKTDEDRPVKLTVIDGPIASVKGVAMPDKDIPVGEIMAPSVTDELTQLTHSRDSSMGSSVGELLGVSANILENGTSEVDSNTSHASPGSDMDIEIVSTEKPGNKSPEVGKHRTKSTGDMTHDAPVPAGGKPPSGMKHSASSPPEPSASAALRRAVSPKRQPAPNRERVNSSQDLLVEMSQQTDDDDDDDDDNEIPPHIQSKIVERSPAERYIRFKEKLGSGAYKDVFRAYDTIEGIEVAWNVVKLMGVPKAERVRIVNEVRLLERLHHPNIISFHGSWVNRETERVIFVTEILSSGTLKSFVQKVQLIRWKIFKRWAMQILRGLEYLHSQDPPIIHRDLKCDNIFINGTSGDLRIGDFGLSTAISNKNQPLSVLGTPEFMAPELYDENYNEKVDIYAFGMLLLEIITRDVPYHECSNPAQIYKKVTQGIPPSSIRRVKSNDARNFILLCLGIGEDASMRPSASELLKHEFLTKKSDDEATIEVEPAVEDMVIEENRNSMTFSDTGSEHSKGSGGKNETANNKKKYSSSIDGHAIPSKGKSGGKPPRIEKIVVLPKGGNKSLDSKDMSISKASMEDEGTDDHFGEMPENEANMKKVTVLMGRGTALDEDNDPPAQEMEVISLSTTPPLGTIKTSLPRSSSEAETSSLGSTSHYRVSLPPGEEVIDGAVKPYPGNNINLVLTLPDEGQTRIEFDFDLVDDDPVQVAREMVTELEEVPDDAVLDISGAISGVARQARMKQNQWTNLQQQQQAQVQQQQHVQQQQNVLAQQHQQALQQQQQQHQAQQQQQQGMMMHPQGSVHQGSVTMQPPQGIPLQNAMMMPPQQHMYGSGFASTGNFQNSAGSHLATPGTDPSLLGPSSTALQQQQPQSQLQTLQPQLNHVAQQQPPPPPPSTQMSTPQIISTPQISNAQATQMSTPNPQQHQMMHGHQQIPATPAPVSQAPAGQQFTNQPNLARSNSITSSMEIPSHESAQMQGQQQRPLTQQPAVSQPQQMQHLPPSTSNSSQQDMAASRQLAPQPVAPLDVSAKSLQSQNAALQGGVPPQMQKLPHPQPPKMTAPTEGSGDVATGNKEVATAAKARPDNIASADDSFDETFGPDTEEIRRLELEFEKKMQRAKKSYGTRMDNLHRSKEEAEAQHQMTLDKHERERIEFEKRVRLAEDEQARRLNQIQKEFIEKKKEVRQQNHVITKPVVQQQQQQQQPVLQQNGSAVDSMRSPLLSGGHKRSSSHFDASMSSMSSMPSLLQPHQQPSPMLTEHKRTSSEADINLADIQTIDSSQLPKQQAPRSGGVRPPNLPKGGPSSRQLGSAAGAPISTGRDRSGSTSS